jgi:hypothetical protein
MPSPDNLAQFAGLDDDAFESRFSSRTIVEWFLRVLGLAALLLALWLAIRVQHVQPTAWARGGKVRNALALWSTREAPHHAHAVFDSIPSPDLRDWVAALPAAGTQTSWEGTTLKPSAVVVEPVADPKPTARIWLAAPNGSSVVVRDTLTEIDSLRMRSGGAVVTAPHVEGVVRAIVGGTAATSILRDSLTIKPILLLGIASWEGKFILASLEEHGWDVDAQFGLSPKTAGTVIQGDPTLTIDTAHYGAVIVLDTSTTKYASQITDFVHKGGGFIAAGDAAALPAFASLMPGVVSGKLLSSAFGTDTAHPRRAFELLPITQLKPGAVAVEHRDDHIAVAARRIETGRVLQVGYIDTWRWRMGGTETDPLHDYTSWWSSMVSSIVYAPHATLPTSASIEPTPMASLVSTLGPSETEQAPQSNPLDDTRLLPILCGIMLGAFLLEWASRRLRGRA